MNALADRTARELAAHDDIAYDVLRSRAATLVDEYASSDEFDYQMDESARFVTPNDLSAPKRDHKVTVQAWYDVLADAVSDGACSD